MIGSCIFLKYFKSTDLQQDETTKNLAVEKGFTKWEIIWFQSLIFQIEL